MVVLFQSVMIDFLEYWVMNNEVVMSVHWYLVKSNCPWCFGYFGRRDEEYHLLTTRAKTVYILLAID